MLDEPEIGDLIAGKYRLTRSVGRGGMGEVYEAEHEELGKRVAVKFIRPELAGDSGGVARFRREARAAAATGHRSIIDVYDIGTTDAGSIFLVMELLEGESLAHKLAREERVDISTACYIVAQVLSALEAAHGAGIIHRDVKPDNVFLVQTGQRQPDVKLLDFGTSQMSDPNSPEDRLTESGVALGTPYYMAPEQALGEKELDHRVDVYAAGVILYECLTNELPFRADNLYALVRRIVDAPLVPPRELRQDLPEGLERVVLKALARDREDRYDSAADLLLALMPFMDDVAAARVSLPECATGADGAAMASKTQDIFAVDTLAAGSADPGRKRAPLKTEATGTRGRWIRAIVALVLAAAAAMGLVLMFGGDGGTTADRDRPPDLEHDGVPGAEAADASPSVHAVGAEEGAAPTDRPVTITLDGVPDWATITVDGEEVDGPHIELQRSVATRHVRVTAEGFLPWHQSLRPDGDKQLHVELERGGSKAIGGTTVPAGGTRHLPSTGLDAGGPPSSATGPGDSSTARGAAINPDFEAEFRL